MRGAIRDFIEATTPYKVCDAVDDGVSAIRKAMEAHCDVIFLRPSTALQDTLVTVSLVRNKLPHVKIVGLSTSSVDLGNRVSPTTGFDAVVSTLSKLIAILKALILEPPSGSAGGAFPALS